MVVPALSHTVNEIDREIRLVLTGRGPEYWAQSSLQSSNVRRVRNLYYTREFANLVCSWPGLAMTEHVLVLLNMFCDQ